MKALIFAAGYATRLYPITKEYPKPLLAVNNKAIIDYILDKLQKINEIDEILVVTNSKFISQFRKWRKSLQIQKPLRLIDDLTKDNASRLGAIGDMDFVINKRGIKGDLLVIGGDNLFDGGLKDFISFTRSKHGHPVIGAFNIGNKANAGKYGVLKLDRESRVVDFKEKPKSPNSTLVAMCVYYFPKHKLKLIKEYLSDEDKKYDATGLYIDWLRKKLAVYGFVFEGRWYDIGDHKFYDEAKRRFVKQ